MVHKLRKRFLFPFILVLLLVATRIYLPFWITDYVNKVLADVPGFHGQVEEIDVHLWRGAYQIQNLSLMQLGSDLDHPFIQVPQADISIEWDALLSKRIVAEVTFIDPVITFATVTEDSITQDGSNVDWTKPIKKLVPMQINNTDNSISFEETDSNFKSE